MRRFILCASALLIAAALPGENIRFGVVDKTVIEQRLNTVSKKIPEREATILRLFAEAGCTGDHLTEQRVKGTKFPNLICTLPGDGPETFIVGAHYDFGGAGQGVIDNWTGASLLPSLYQSLKIVPRRHTFVFVAFAAEEKGLVGSRYYAKQIAKTDIPGIAGMVNIDSIGMTTTRMELERGDKTLIHELAATAKILALPLGAVDVYRVGISDAVSFQDRKIPSITIHSATQQNWHTLHSTADNLGAVHLDEYYDSFRLLSAYLAYLDSRPPANPPAAEASGR